KARQHLTYLERRWRGTPHYPEVVWRLMGVEFQANRRHIGCRWARKLYSRHPGHSIVADWGVDLEKNKYMGKSIACMASMKLVRERVRYLSLSGFADRARKEIDILRERAKPSEKYELDTLL